MNGVTTQEATAQMTPIAVTITIQDTIAAVLEPDAAIQKLDVVCDQLTVLVWSSRRPSLNI